MKQKETLFGSQSSPTKQKNRITERGELLRFFSEEMNLKIPRIAFMLQGLSKEDIYFMKTAFQDRKRRGGIDTARKWFWWSLRA